MFEESSVGVLAFMSKRTSLVSNVMHSVRHALHINLHMFVCLQAVFFIGTWAIYGLAGLLGARCSVFAVARYPIAFVSTSSLQPRSALDTSLYECLYGLCLHLLVHVRLAERIDVQMFEESSVGVLAFMIRRTSLVSNVMHSFRHALHINLHMFVCL